MRYVEIKIMHPESLDQSDQEFVYMMTEPEVDMLRKFMLFIANYEVIPRKAPFRLDENNQNVYTYKQDRD